MRASREFRDGITNGAEWYILYGGMQDWNYVATSDMEITVEVSFDKYPPASQLGSYWDDNRASLYNYVLQAVRLGVRGVITTSGNKGSCKIAVESRQASSNYARIDHDVVPQVE